MEELEGDKRRRHDKARRAAAAEESRRRQLQETDNVEWKNSWNEPKRMYCVDRPKRRDSVDRRPNKPGWMASKRARKQGAVATQLQILRENTTDASEFAVRRNEDNNRRQQLQHIKNASTNSFSFQQLFQKPNS
jgi:hypothetical protein